MSLDLRLVARLQTMCPPWLEPNGLVGFTHCGVLHEVVSGDLITVLLSSLLTSPSSVTTSCAQIEEA